MNDFFTKKQIKSYLSGYKEGFVVEIQKKSYEDNSFESSRDNYLLMMLEEFMDNPKFCDESSQLSIKYFKDLLTEQLKNIQFDSKNINLTFVCCASFIVERFLITDENSVSAAGKIKSFIINQQNKFDERSFLYIDFIIKEMPLSMLKEYLTSSNVNAYRQFNSNIQKLTKLNAEWEGFIEKKEAAVKTLEDNLENQKIAFNFVGLTEGFYALGDEKKTELKTSKRIMLILGIAFILPLSLEILFFMPKIDDSTVVSYFASLLPIFSITVILAYFFRISLNNYQSIKAQLIQIELRKNLCKFIQNYADYAKTIKQQDAGLLVKFEEIVFSNIMPSENQIPSTFDGVEQLASLVKSLQGK